MKYSKSFRIIAVLLCVACAVSVLSITVGADMGPKASVRILFENMGDDLCYGTLLSKTESVGPSSVWDGTAVNAGHNENENYPYANLDYETWKAFAEYTDPDGYFFLQEGWLVSETKKIEWTYYPPSSFKILLYYPKTNNFVASGICERYAFDTYYTADMENMSVSSVEYGGEINTALMLTVSRSYDCTQEIVFLAARIVITILIEMAIALLFGFREKKQILLLTGVNTATQILLNVLLNIANYNSGPMVCVILYMLFEVIVFVIEAVIYCTVMNRLSEQSKRKRFYVIYSLIANAASFGIGILLSRTLPGIF